MKRKSGSMFERLRQIRKERCITCEEMAGELGLQTKSAYSKKERECVPFTLQEAKKISEIFGMSIEEIFFRNGVRQ